MKKYYISDLHLFDRKIIKSAHRPHKNLEEMHTDIIIKWNKKVSKNDIVYIIGDIGAPDNNKEKFEIIKILKSLNGKKILIIGNHDREIIRDTSFKKCFAAIKEYCRILDNYKRVILFHFPIEDWEGKSKGTIHIHGHIHNKNINFMKNRYHAGCDVQNFTPVSLNELINKKS